MNIPNEEEYKAALKIVESYKKNQEIIFQEKAKEIKIDLDEYFKTTYIKKYSISTKFDFFSFGEFNISIYPIEPSFDEDYEGDLDDGIEKIAKKHKVSIGMGGGIYSK